MSDQDEIKNNEPEIDTDRGDEDVDEFVFEDNTEVTGGDYKQKVDKLKARIKELEKKGVYVIEI